MKKFIKYGIGVVVVGGIGYLFATGVLDKDAAKQAGRQAYYGSRGAASSLLTKKPKGSPAAAAKCRDNLKLIERAKRGAAQKKGMSVGVITNKEIAAEMGQSFPKCPDGGLYKPNPILQLPQCTIFDNGTQDKSDDHIIYNF